MSPKTQLSCVTGWKFSPRIVTSIPPYVGPDAGIRRWILGKVSEVTGGDDLGLKKRNGVGCGGRSCGRDCDTGETRGDGMVFDTGDMTGFETNEVSRVSSGC
jgi:hypothetical protein